ncbi:unnamed protein product [Schistosoma mattheei]|uniref:EF-hand domain-containing protein n=1 Tax=Schistosoma mattheei TaxID=31246 RepID=A0AA85BC39_9TREM|nr:unnamed protein product [Schistosoma mattheei]
MVCKVFFIIIKNEKVNESMRCINDSFVDFITLTLEQMENLTYLILNYQCTHYYYSLKSLNKHKMEPFVQVFFAIDKDGTETITIDELKKYVADNNLDEMMVTKWKSLFDAKNTGKITFSTFCEVLGLSPAQAVAMKTQHQQSASAKLHPDVVVIYEQLPLDKQIAISNKAIEILTSPKKLDEKDQAVQLKQWLDNTYGKAWHVVIVKGSFWSSYSHSANKCFIFRVRDVSYLIWRTPDEEITST